MSAPTSDDPRDEPRDRVQLSVAQIAGSSLAAVSAAVLCSFFGVAGTVIGTAAASMIATVGSAVYAYSVRRTQARLRRLHQAGANAPAITAVLQTARGQGPHLPRKVPWRIVLLGTANVFVFAIALVTGIEGIIGRSLPAEFGVSHGGADSTSLGSIFHSSHHKKHKKSPSPAPTKTSTPTSPSPSSPSPTVTSPSPTRTPTTPTSTPSTPQPTPSISIPLPSPSASHTP